MHNGVDLFIGKVVAFRLTRQAFNEEFGVVSKAPFTHRVDFSLYLLVRNVRHLWSLVEFRDQSCQIGIQLRLGQRASEFSSRFGIQLPNGGHKLLHGELKLKIRYGYGRVSHGWALLCRRQPHYTRVGSL